MRTMGRVLACASLLYACGSESNGMPDAADAAVALDDGFQGCPDTIAPFALGMRAKGERAHITGTLIAASNDPPLRYLNEWTVEFSGSDGTVLMDAVVTKARPFMPVHGHDGIVQPTVESLPETGQFRIRGLNFNMRGPWEIQLTVSSARAGDDYVVFQICVAE